MALGKLGYDFSMLAEAIDKSPSLISKVASRQAKSRFVAESIAKVLGMSVAKVFPDVPEYQLAKPTSQQERTTRVNELRSILGSEPREKK
ncbi:transcriptional regulator [Aliidiomarina taiwanensis]|uniref:Transcriptional regulator n=2 Tax=Aliidiomarina taiwanensis TaxID=946228 RepID=A0A432X965_9GAMM|nr:transcriptional regulator [Aliidiomarina taiwanensis]